MSFLAPVFLAGGLAVALPVLFHLVRRTTRKRMPFSSLMFLLPTPPRLTRRSRLEHLLLLLLRCTVVCLLALGFARPFLKRAVVPAPGPAESRRTLLMVDSSASMRRADLWAQAKKKVESFLSDATPADHLALFTFDRQLKPLLEFQEWDSAPAGERPVLARGKLGQAAPGWFETRLGNALISAAEMLAESASNTVEQCRIVLVSDLQEGSHLEPIQGYEWPKNISLQVEPLESHPSGNAALQLVNHSEGADVKSVDEIRVRVSNSSDSAREQFTIGWSGPPDSAVSAQPVKIYVPPGQSRIVSLPAPRLNAGLDRLMLRGDDEDFDNTVYVLPPQVQTATVVYLGSDSEQDLAQALYFLRRAFQPAQSQRVELLVRSLASPLSYEDLKSATLIIVNGSLSEGAAQVLRNQLAEGKTILSLVPESAAASGLSKLLGGERVNVDDGQPGDYAMLADIDFRHPLFAPFADPRFSDFTRIHFWKYRRLDFAAVPNARVLARFDSGDAALVEVPSGSGRLLVMASGWQPSESQLALSTKFVPLLYSLLEESGAAPPITPEYHVGDSVPLPSISAVAGSTPVLLPDGSRFEIAAGETNFSRTLMPGIYSVGTGPLAPRFAVNLDPTESRTTPLAGEELERLGAPLARQAPLVHTEAQKQLRLQNAELEARQRLWRWFIGVAIGLLLLETWLAGRTGRKAIAPEAASL